MRHLALPLLLATTNCYLDSEYCFTPFRDTTPANTDTEICPGEYRGKTFLVGDGVTLSGENVTLNAKKKQDYPVIRIRGSEVTIAGLTIGGYFGGISVSGTNVTIINNRIQSLGKLLDPKRPADYCIRATGENLAILDNIIGNCHTGIYMKGSGEIRNNTLGPGYIGVNLEGDITFENNTVRSFNEAIKASEDVEIGNNTLEDNLVDF